MSKDTSVLVLDIFARRYERDLEDVLAIALDRKSSVEHLGRVKIATTPGVDLRRCYLDSLPFELGHPQVKTCHYHPLKRLTVYVAQCEMIGNDFKRVLRALLLDGWEAEDIDLGLYKEVLGTLSDNQKK